MKAKTKLKEAKRRPPKTPAKKSRKSKQKAAKLRGVKPMTAQPIVAEAPLGTQWSDPPKSDEGIPAGETMAANLEDEVVEEAPTGFTPATVEENDPPLDSPPSEGIVEDETLPVAEPSDEDLTELAGIENSDVLVEGRPDARN